MSSKQALAVGLALSGAVAAGYVIWKIIDEEEAKNWKKSKKKISTEPVCIEVRIPKAQAGVVLGRHGINIREIANKTNTTIHVKDEVAHEASRTLLVQGSPDDAQLAEILIHQTILNQPRMETLELQIPSEATGLVIGRNGDRIRDIQMQSRCRIDVDRGAAPSDDS